MAKELTTKQMVKALYDKAFSPATAMGTQGKPSGGQIDPAKEVELPKVWNLFPKPGDKYTGVENCPKGHHPLFNWNKAGEYIFVPDCGTL